MKQGMLVVNELLGRGGDSFQIYTAIDRLNWLGSVALVNWWVHAILSLEKCESKQMLNHITHNNKSTWNQQRVVNHRRSRPRIQHQTVRKDLVGGLPNLFNPSFLLELTFKREREREREQKCSAYAKSILANVLQGKFCVLLINGDDNTEK